jgi:hypothetical protein
MLPCEDEVGVFVGSSLAAKRFEFQNPASPEC